MSSKLVKCVNKLLSSFLEKLYTKYAFAYDLVAWIASNGKWNKWVYEIIPYIQGEKLLELGIGPGHLYSHLAANKISIFGVDKSSMMLKIASRNFNKKANLNDKFESFPALTRTCTEALPFQNMVFDTILATFPSTYIEQPATLNNIYRVLKEDGKLVILLAVKPIGKSLLTHFLKILYEITGQTISEDSAVLRRIAFFFSEQGFDTRVSWENQNDVQLLFVEAKKNSLFRNLP